MRSFVDNLADVKRMMANFAGVRLSTALTATLQWISDCLCSGGGALTRTLLPLSFIKLWQQFVWRNSSRITIIPQNIILIHGSNSRREVRCGRTDVNSSICAMGDGARFRQALTFLSWHSEPLTLKTRKQVRWFRWWLVLAGPQGKGMPHGWLPWQIPSCTPLQNSCNGVPRHR